jgi:transcriptional regulator with XRE-family HTH domain
METFGRRLLTLRKLYNYSQSTVARLIEISQPNYNRYEKDKIIPNLHFIKKILDFYCIDSNWLLLGKGDIFKVGYWTGYGHRLKIIRNHFDLKQSEFAERLCISRTKLSNYENNQPAPFDFLIRLCLSYNVNLNWLFTAYGEKIFTLFSGHYHEPINLTDEFVKQLKEGIKHRFKEFLKKISSDVESIAFYLTRPEIEIEHLWDFSNNPDYKSIWILIDEHNLNLNWLLADIGSALYAKEDSYIFDEYSSKFVSLDPMALMNRIDQLEKELKECNKSKESL